MADLFLIFVRATQIVDWAIQNQSAAEIVPWYFAYDHLNYVRYLPVYIYVKLVVPDTYHFVAEHLAAGEFVVQQQNQYSFSQTSMDQTIEQTMNKDSKTKDGQIGLFNNSNAFHRWILSFNQHVEISWSCTEMAGKKQLTAMRKKTLVSLDMRRVKQTF